MTRPPAFSRSTVVVAALLVAACGADSEDDAAAGGNGSLPQAGLSAGGASGGSAGLSGAPGAGGTLPPGGGAAVSGSSGQGGSAAAAGSPTTGGQAGASAAGSPNAGGTGPGGSTSGGAPAGGAANAGAGPGSAASGGAGTGGSGGGNPAYTCNGSSMGYDAVVSSSGANWVAQRNGSNVYSGSDMAAAIQAAINALTSGRTSKQSILVQGSGSIPNNRRVEVASYTVLNVCGTINVTNASGSGDQAPIYAREHTDIEIPNATITGVPLYGMFFRDVSNLHLGQIELRLSNAGLGIRIDNHGSNRANKVRNIRIDNVHVEGTSNHGVETYGVDGLTIGTVVARSTGYAGLLLNDTINATVGIVDADNAAHGGTGYAAFRIANRAGQVGNSWPANSIRVGQVIARRGGRGIFCVSDSGGLTIDRIDLENTGNNAILLENCHNVRIAAVEGLVRGGGEVRIAHRTDEHTPSSNITLQNLNVTGTTIRESPCGSNIVICNISGGASVTACSGTARTTCP